MIYDYEQNPIILALCLAKTRSEGFSIYGILVRLAASNG